MRELMTVSEASTRLGVKAETVKRWILEGRVPFGMYVPPKKGKVNGSWYVRRQALERWLSA
jgi:predicted site-specific integrase-resolvase